MTPSATSCFLPLRTPVRKATCAADGDCATPAVCTNGSCGLKSPGDAPTAECARASARKVSAVARPARARLSCALATTAGTCTPVASGDPDPTGTCQNAGPATCDTTGFCDGKGACELFPAGTSCAAPTCPANGTTQMLSHANFEFNWHLNYIYAPDAAPILPKGTILRITAWHDNTSANKANPDPNQWVGWGERTVDEMAHAWVNITYMGDDDLKAEIEKRRAGQSMNTQQQ